MKIFLTTLSLLLCSLTLAAQTETILHSFANNGTDGYQPQAGLAMDSEGNLYGTTFYGGLNGTGTVYELSASSWTESILHSFTAFGVNGPEYPNSVLVFDNSGNLYGTTDGDYNSSNANEGGALYELTKVPAVWGVITLKDFSGNPPPPNGVIFDGDGNLWGSDGEGAGCAHPTGSVAELTPASGTWRATYYDLGCVESGHAGVIPVGILGMDATGNFYGATSEGGTAGKGTIFKLNTSSGTLTYLFNFDGTDGAAPSAGVIFDNEGNFYGTTTAGGSAGKGNVYEFSPDGSSSWIFRTLFSFNGANGQAPGALSFDANGNLWGTTTLGGAHGAGAVFELTSSGGKWTETVIHSFGGSGDGSTPVGALIFDSLGNVYGVTSGGGANGVGTVWEVTP